MPVTYDTSFLDRLAPNVAALFLDRVERTPDHEAYRYPRDGGWESVTWRETGTRVRRLAAGLLSLGIEREQRVGIASSTRYEWILADLAVMCAGAATTTVYPSTNAEDTAYILSDSECRVVFTEDDEQIAKVKEHKAELPHLLRVVTFDGTTDDSWVIDLEQLGELGDAYLAEHPDVIDEVAASIEPEQLATLIYTSGTTGRPKGVRLQHRSWVYEGAAIDVMDILHEDDLQFLWLPMAHSFGKVLLSTQLACGFATAIDGRVEKIVDNLGVVKPTFMGAAPRIFEKAHGRIVTMQQSEGGAKEKIFNQAFKVGLKVEDSGATASPSRCRCGCSTGSSTSWSSARCASASVAGCASSSPVPRRSTRTSPSGSTPPASSSSRATGSPRPRPGRSSTTPTSTRWARSGPRCPAARSSWARATRC